jgi:hypothetical protein
MKNKKLSVDEIKVGDKVIFNDGREKITLTIRKIDLKKREISVTWRRRETFLMFSDFVNGYITKK